MVISVDFDGTCVTHDFPQTGKNIGADVVLKVLTDNGHKIICTTMRSYEHVYSFGVETIEEVKKWFKINGIELYAINNNPDQNWSKSRKIYANLYIDDQALGCPLITNKMYSNRSFVDWYKVAVYFLRMSIINNKTFLEIHDELISKYPTLYMKYETTEI